MGRGVRVIIYDATWVGSKPDQWFLTTSWILGALLYRLLGRIDRSYGATSWADALAWLHALEPDVDIAEVQYWGHGKWGRALIGAERFDARVLDDESHPMHPAFAAVRSRFTPASLWWFRSCMTFGTEAGHRFASSCARFFGCRVAGHTYVVGPLQSGLHSLAPGDTPTWSTSEGVARGDEPKSAWTRAYEAWLHVRTRGIGTAVPSHGKKREPTSSPGGEPTGLMSSRAAPQTITCLDGTIPHGW